MKMSLTSDAWLGEVSDGYIDRNLPTIVDTLIVFI